MGLIPGSGPSPGGRKWQPTPVFLPEKFHGQRNLWVTVHGVAWNWTRLCMHQHTLRGLSYSQMEKSKILFSSVQLLSHVRLFATPWTAAHQASMNISFKFLLGRDGFSLCILQISLISVCHNTNIISLSYYIKFNFLKNFVLTMLDLCCCAGFSLNQASRGYSLVVAHWFSLQRLLLRRTGSRVWRLQELRLPGSRAQAQQL